MFCNTAFVRLSSDRKRSSLMKECHICLPPQDTEMVSCLPQDRYSNTAQFSSGSLPRNACISVPPSQAHSPYQSHPISRISIPPIPTQSHQHKPIPLSVIMRLQNPYWGAMSTPQPRGFGGEGDMYQANIAIQQPVLQPQPPELWQPALYSDGKHLCRHLHTHVCGSLC